MSYTVEPRLSNDYLKLKMTLWSLKLSLIKTISLALAPLIFTLKTLREPLSVLARC